MGGARLQNLGHLSGERTYYLTGPLAELELALINWTTDTLTKKVSYLQFLSDDFVNILHCTIWSILYTVNIIH